MNNHATKSCGLIVAVFAAFSLAFSAYAEPAAAAASTNAPAAAAASAAPAPRSARARPQISPERRAQMREQREKFIAARRAEMQARSIEIIKKYGLDDEKAKALLDELESTLRPSRRAPARAPRRAAEGSSKAVAPAK